MTVRWTEGENDTVRDWVLCYL